MTDLTGKDFGSWKVVQREPNNKHGGSMWLCQCVCGKEKVVSANCLLMGDSKSCGSHFPSRRIDLIGKTFARLTVEQFSHIGHQRRAYWKCKCICGNTSVVAGESLRQGITRSCGCLVPDVNKQLNTLPEGETRLRSKFRTYKQSAKEKGRQWDLTEEEFRRLVSLPCFYCGTSAPSGVDRADNSEGYTLGNSRPCCKVCNYAKNTMSEADFLAWIARVFHYQQLGTEDSNPTHFPAPLCEV